MTTDTIQELRVKAELYDFWEHVHLYVRSIYDFDNSLSAEELKDTLSTIITLESYGGQ